MGQILEIQQRNTPDVWEWSKRYIKLDVKAKSERLTRNQLVIEVPSALLTPLSPLPLQVSSDAESANRETTWKIPNLQLEKVLEISWDNLNPDTNDLIGNIAALPKIVNPEALPYRDLTGTYT